MKCILSLLLCSLLLTPFLYSKSRLGEYYYGFGYAIADGGKSGTLEGDFLNLSLNSPASDSADFVINFNYGNVDADLQDNTSWALGLDYVVQYNDYMYQNGLFRPFAGIGASYLDDGAKIRLSEDGMAWKLLAGIEILFTEYVSLSLGANFIGLFADFGETDYTVDIGVTWWINDVHGIGLEYNHAFDQDLDLIGLRYLYSWK